MTIDDFARICPRTPTSSCPAVSYGRPRVSTPASRECRCSTNTATRSASTANRHDTRQHMARSKPTRRTNDLGPGLPMLILNRLVVDGGWIERDGVRCFNLYRPPRIKLGDATKAEPWLTMSTGSSTHPATPTISSIGWLTACSTRATNSITRSCSAESRASARTLP